VGNSDPGYPTQMHAAADAYRGAIRRFLEREGIAINGELADLIRQTAPPTVIMNYLEGRRHG
jgi:hypothetical protein